MRRINTRQAFLKTDFKTRTTEQGDKYIEGYFIRFNEETELWKGVFEEVAPESVTNSLKNNDIRSLFNHDTSLVLGRTGNNTLELRKDDTGLYGSVRLNPKDSQAMDAFARIERGDINACSFGFNIVKEDFHEREDGTVKFTLREIDLHEVSPVTFPAYPNTSIQARKADLQQYTERELQIKKSKLKERLNNA